MNKFISCVLILFFVTVAAVGSDFAAPPPVKLFMSPASRVPSAEVLKNLGDKCPNVTITLNSKESDYMLEAGGWPGHYLFTVYRKGGTAVYSTQTQWLHNAVKDVCHYVNNAPKQ